MLSNEDVKGIKRINQRLTQLEKSGFQNTTLYTDLIQRAEDVGIEIRYNKNGNPRLSQSKNQNITTKDIARVERVKKLKDFLKDIKEKNLDVKNYKEIKKLALKALSIRERLKDYIDNYENDMMSISSRKLHKYATSGYIRKMTYEELEDIMNLIDEEKQISIQTATDELFGYTPYEEI